MTDQGRSTLILTLCFIAASLSACQSTGPHPPCDPDRFVQPVANKDCQRYPFHDPLI